MEVQHDVQLGLSPEGTWVVSAGGRDIPCQGPGLVTLFPLLEQPWDVVRERLRATRPSLPPDTLASFPRQELVVAALRSHSDYWAHLALQWCDAALAVPACDELRDALTDLLGAPWASQRTRHTARALLARAEKSQ
jgi:hypothetical protein